MAGPDALTGGTGDDILAGGTGTIDGGEGNDLALLAGSIDAYGITVQADRSLKVQGDDFTDTMANVAWLSFDGKMVSVASAFGIGERTEAPSDDPATIQPAGLAILPGYGDTVEAVGVADAIAEMQAYGSDPRSPQAGRQGRRVGSDPAALVRRGLKPGGVRGVPVEHPVDPGPRRRRSPAPDQPAPRRRAPPPPAPSPSAPASSPPARSPSRWS